ncbi:WxL domain-containing protein [Levilactobacillus yiduensis]|uniref:WxL domain-containing protein n=1 Tax=Levilactobacillus yiduensis TaxID=2953880 RepID=UPI000EF34EDD|nr:WxL domain-containing protein [Levilactobacillus yiduensis]AYM01826.1 hypothetical protein D8911_02025 [Levilactobacillus brevis]
MKKTVSSILLASALLLGSIAPVAANAATVAGTSGSTKTSATFEAPDPVTTPVDPDNPGTKSTGETTDNGSTSTPEATKGGLTFLYVTNAINFGSAKSVTTGTQDLVGTKDSITPENFSGTADNTNFVTEISDTRGSNAGWYVSVGSTPMVNQDDNTTVLKGATVDFNGAGAATKITNSGTLTDKTTGDVVNDGTTGIAANTVSVPTEKTANGADAASQIIYQASADNGAGQTAFQLDPTKISLANVGANTKTGTYAGTLNWTLSDTPVTPAK